MAREVSPVYDFIFCSIRTSLPTDMVDADLTVKGIYTYHKDHTMESTIFTPWSNRSVIPFPLLRKKIQVFKDNKKQNTTMPWNNAGTVQFPGPPKTPRIPRKHALGKTRTSWSNRNHRFNPIKTNRYNAMNTEPMDMNEIDIIKPAPKRACECLSLTCPYCRQDAPHPSPIHSDWFSEDWDGNKAKVKEQKSLIDFDTPKQKTNMEQVMDIDKVPFHKLNLGQDEGSH